MRIVKNRALMRCFETKEMLIGSEKLFNPDFVVQKQRVIVKRLPETDY